MTQRRLGKHSARGQTIVEFALIAPVFFIILFGIIDFGMALDRRITLQHAVREGARYGAVTADCLAIQERTESQARDIITADEVGVRYYEVDGSTLTNPAAAGDVVKVSAPFEWEFPLMSRFGVGSIDIGVSGAARLELAVTSAGGCGP
jgi:Flp pilus assembly protein TadG